ncbi:MAG: carboxylesterase [Desulfuromonas sp.]|nr:MAG: carboxylesterase [Desulfuromonas sp.]
MSEPNIEPLTICADDKRVNLPENMPFRISGSAGNRVGILLVHGFTGSPWEMRAIGRDLAGSVEQVLAIRLPGHGTTAEDLSARTYNEWLSAVEEGYRKLALSCDHVIGIGLSTGALLLLLSAESCPYSGLVLLSPYIRLRQFLARNVGLLKYVFKYNRRPIEAEYSPYYYRDRPLAGVHQINRLIKRVKKVLKRIKMPVLIASAAGDITVDAGSAITIYNRTGSHRKEYYRFGKEVPHVLTTPQNPRLDVILEITRRYVTALTPERAGSTPDKAA